jgi:hypothetical protein
MPRDPRQLRAQRQKALRSGIVPHREGNNLSISFAGTFEAHFGLRLRVLESHRCIQQAFASCTCNWCSELAELKCPPSASGDAIESILQQVVDALVDIAWRPLTPRLVAAALRISGQERVRWTKDGRLPKSGQLLTRRHNGAVLAVPTYAVDMIEHLATYPAILEAWRRQDARPSGD